MSTQDLWINSPFLSLVITGVIALLVEGARKNASLSGAITQLGLIVAIALAIFTFWETAPSFSNMVQTGGYANYFTLLFLVSALLTVILSKPYLERTRWHRGEFYLLIIFATSGMILMASALDLIVLFLGLELMSVSLYVLAGFARTKLISNESGLKYFLLGAFATGFLLYGIALIYGTAGTTNLPAIAEQFTRLADNTLFLIGVGMLIVSFSFKVAAVPFHMWAPDVYQGAPTTVTAFMSTGAKAAAFAAFVSVFLRTFEFSGARVNEALAYSAAASMILGNVIAIAQTNLKRLLAYSSIAHAGYMLVGLAAANNEGQTGILFYLSAYTAMNLGAFGIISLMEQEGDKNLTFDDYAGLSSRRPFVAALMAVFMFSLAGIPPFAGFFGKYYVFLAAVKADMTWLAVIGVLTSVVSVYYYLRLVVTMYFRDGEADLPAQPTKLALAVLCLAALVVLQLGLFPSTILDITQRFF
ncbi:MAG TPA: NADH-quinone oxidoreductase subunit N [Bacteroidota bacterium]|nr:NADH-quinone oxidoreductase subunit N [Bacteroidota bacterium]